MDDMRERGTGQDRGSIMIALVLIVTPLLVLVSSAITTMTTRNHGQVRSIQSEQAMLAVESGLDQAIYINKTVGLVNGTNISRTLGPNFSFVVEPLLLSTDGVDNDGDTDVDEADENVWQLTITGTYGRATRKVAAYFGQVAGSMEVEASVMTHNPNMLVTVGAGSKILGDDTVIKKTILCRDQVAGNIVCFEQSGRRLVGYWLGRHFWGNGIATRALSEFLALVSARPLDAHVAKDNVGSIRVLQKCGFTLSGERNAPAVDGSEVVEEFVFTLAT